MRGVGGGCIWRRLCRFLVGALGRRFVGVRIDEEGRGKPWDLNSLCRISLRRCWISLGRLSRPVILCKGECIEEYGERQGLTVNEL